MSSSAASLFAKLARGYCTWFESGDYGENPFEQAASWLARLYAAALELPNVEPVDAADIEHHFDVKKVSPNVSIFWNRSYRFLFDPRIASEDEPIQGNLGDDLSDIHDDLMRGLLLFDAGQIENAVFEWRFSHRTHWGQHATGALFGIHWLVIGGLE